MMSTAIAKIFVGVDVSKASLDVHRPDTKGGLGGLEDTTYFWGVVANRIGNFYAG